MPPAFRIAPRANIQAREPGAFRSWTDTNLSAHRAPGYASVTVTFKAPGQTPGDASAGQMRLLADLAERFGHSDLRIAHDQNVVPPHVHKSDLYALYLELKAAGAATANAGLISDIIACPGMDYCALATARSIPVAQDIADHFRARGLGNEIGKFNIRISGCINACGHHHWVISASSGAGSRGCRELPDHARRRRLRQTAAIGERAGAGFADGGGRACHRPRHRHLSGTAGIGG